MNYILKYGYNIIYLTMCVNITKMKNYKAICSKQRLIPIYKENKDYTIVFLW